MEGIKKVCQNPEEFIKLVSDLKEGIYRISEKRNERSKHEFEIPVKAIQMLDYYSSVFEYGRTLGDDQLTHLYQYIFAISPFDYDYLFDKLHEFYRHNKGSDSMDHFRDNLLELHETFFSSIQ